MTKNSYLTRAIDFLEKHYYDKNEREATEALRNALVEEDILTQKRIMKKFLLKAKQAWTDDIKGADPEWLEEIRSNLTIVNQLLKE